MDDLVRHHQMYLLEAIGLYLGGRAPSERVSTAFFAAPRHLFVERYCTFINRTWRNVTADNLNSHLAALYANDALGIFVNEGDSRIATISAPEIVLYMLELLALAPGHRVYEVGAGSGWNAALMSRLVTPGGSVDTVEIIPELVEAARRGMARAGIDNVRVHDGDASLGPAGDAVFDRAVFTAGASDLPASFFAQIRPGSLLLFTLAVPGGGNVLILFERTARGFDSRTSRRCSFVAVTGGGSAAGAAAVALESLVDWPRWSTQVIETRPFFLTASGVTPHQDRSCDLRSYLWLADPGFRVFTDAAGRSCFGIVDDATGSLALVRAGMLTVYGAAAAGERLRGHLRTWVEHGLPGMADFTVIAHPAHEAPPVSGDALVLRRAETCFVFRLPVRILRVVGDGSVAGAGTGDVTIRDAWPYGVVWVVEQIWQQLGVDEILQRHAGTHKAATVAHWVRAIFAMVANRTHAPYSKLHCWEQWLRDDVFLPEARELELHHLYLGMDFLEEHKGEVEKAIYFAMADLMHADVDLIFYDWRCGHHRCAHARRPLQGSERQPPRQGGLRRGWRAATPLVVRPRRTFQRSCSGQLEHRSKRRLYLFFKRPQRSN